MTLAQQTKVPNNVLVIPNKPLKQIKTEVLLTFVAELFENYFRIKNDPSLSCSANFIDNETVDLSLKEFLHYFNARVIRKKELLKTFNDANLNTSNMIHAKQYEIYGVYFRKLGSLLMQFITKDSKFMPDYFGILLMYYYKTEANKKFFNFEFIQEFDFAPLLTIYEDVNIDIKKEFLKKNTTAKIWEQRTTIDNMEKIALHLIEKYIAFQCKINILRKSKKR